MKEREREAKVKVVRSVDTNEKENIKANDIKLKLNSKYNKRIALAAFDDSVFRLLLIDTDCYSWLAFFGIRQ